jgi:hypothetical protein
MSEILTEPEPIYRDIEDDEEGEDLIEFWNSLYTCKQLYDSIKREIAHNSSYTNCSLLDQLTVEDLMDWLYPEFAIQLQMYIEEQDII